MFNRLVVALAVGVGALACGVGGSTGRCDLRPARAQCTDIRNLLGPLITLQMLCGTLSAVLDGGSSGIGGFVDGKACDTTGSVGGCQATNLDGSKQTNWYYPPKTADAARGDCESAMKFVPPS